MATRRSHRTPAIGRYFLWINVPGCSGSGRELTSNALEMIRDIMGGWGGFKEKEVAVAFVRFEQHYLLGCVSVEIL